jgi:hypothetical protein
MPKSGRPRVISDRDDRALHCLVRRMPFVTSLYLKEHPASCPLRWRRSNGLGCISHDCQLEIITIQGNLTGDRYIRDVLQPVVPYFDKHALATMHVYKDDNAQASSFKSSNRLPPKRSRDLCSLAVMSPDLNPIEHIWDKLGHRILTR